MPPRPKRQDLWQEFHKVGEKVLCRHCPWVGLPHATRMAIHLGKCKGAPSASAAIAKPAEEEEEQANVLADAEDEGVGIAASEPDPEAPKQKMQKLPFYFDRAFSASEQFKTEVRQAYCMVMNGWSATSQERDWTSALLLSLRPDYRPPSRTALSKHVSALHSHIEQLVQADLARIGVVSLAFDGWHNHQSAKTIAISAILPTGKSYLLSFKELEGKETGEVLAMLLSETIANMLTIGVHCVGAIAGLSPHLTPLSHPFPPSPDNAANCQNAIKIAHVLQLNCHSHCVNLWLKDICFMYERQFAQLAELEEFFKHRNLPHQVYQSSKLANETNLVGTTDTRWGSQVDCLTSVLHNRRLIEASVCELRRMRFEFIGNELVFVWDLTWWKTLEDMSHVYLPLKLVTAQVQKEGFLLASSIELALPAFTAAMGADTLFAPGDRRKARAICDNRRAMMFTPTALVANLLHPKYRGRSLPSKELRLALEEVAKCGEHLQVAYPTPEEVLDFVGGQPPYDGNLECHPWQYWTTLFKDDPLSPLGRVMSTLPASQATVERVFSSAQWQCESRGRLSQDLLAKEVYIRNRTPGNLGDPGGRDKEGGAQSEGKCGARLVYPVTGKLGKPEWMSHCG